MMILLIGIVGLTVQAIREDQLDPLYVEAVAGADEQGQRVKQLAWAQGIPPGGAIALLRADAKTQGPELFARSCGQCHLYQDPSKVSAETKSTAPNLWGFGTRRWLEGLLDPEQVAGPNYFGRTSHAEGEMAEFVKTTIAEMDATQTAALAKATTALAAEAGLPPERGQHAVGANEIAAGAEALKTEVGCTDCHRFHDVGELGTAPDLTGWASREWLAGIISDPNHERFYGENNDGMPAFGTDRILDGRQIGLIVDWLRGEWYEPPTAGENMAAKDGSSAVATAPASAR
jgi:ubiquinol-cytochrome c reductase cytochrome b subunit